MPRVEQGSFGLAALGYEECYAPKGGGLFPKSDCKKFGVGIEFEFEKGWKLAHEDLLPIGLHHIV